MTTHTQDLVPRGHDAGGDGEPGLWLAAQLAVLAVVAAVAHVDAIGIAIATGYAGVLLMLLDRALRRSGRIEPGPADRVTLARAVLVGGVIAMVADQVMAGEPRPAGVLVGLAGLALVLDGVDGRIARRTGTATPEGARFDLEVDALLILVLSVAVARSLGAWVLAIGAMRYAFLAASWLLPWLRAPLPTRYSAKVVAVQQGITLLVAAAGVVPTSFAVIAVAAALATLTWSFGHDVGWLWQRRGERASALTASRHPGRRPRR